MFELMDPNPSNPVFLVHVFRVVELPTARMSPKDWENHYKLDVMIGTIKPVVPLQAYQRHYDGESRILQAYQPLSSSSEDEQDEDEPSQTSSQPSNLPQLKPSKPKTKAIYSALVRRKTVDDDDNAHSDSVQYDVGEGTSRTVETLSHIGSGQAEICGESPMPFSHIELVSEMETNLLLAPNVS